MMWMHPLTQATILTIGLLVGARQPLGRMSPAASQPIGNRLQAGSTLVLVSHDRYPAHAEPSLAVNPRDALNLLGASQVIAPGLHTVETFSSFDGGKTWHDNGPLSLPDGADWADDVTVSFDGQGAGFVAAMATTRTAQGLSQTARGVYIWRTDDGGRTFHSPVAVVHGHFADHPWLAADIAPGAAGLYVAWSAGNGADFNRADDGLAFSRSVDGGRHFTTPHIISAPPGGVLVPMVAPGPGGEVAVTYVQGSGSATAPDAENADTMSQASPTANKDLDTPIAVISSIDHGQHFGQPAILAPSPHLGVPTGPSVTADPHDGTIYVAFASVESGTTVGGNSIVVMRSRSHARSWDAPVTVTTAGPAIVFQPQVVVDDAGTVDVTYFALTDGRVDLLLGRSTGRTLRFRPVVRVTPTTFDPAVSRAGSGGKHGAWWIGDYQGLAAGGGQIHPFWNDTRSGRLDIFTTAISVTGAQ